MVERRIDWEILFIALVMTGAIMAGIFFIGTELSEAKVDDISTDLDELRTEQNAQELTRRLATSIPGDNCRALNLAIDRTAADVQNVQAKVAAYEDAQRLDSPRYTVLKKQYMNLLTEYYLTARQVQDSCDEDKVLMLYFYRQGGECSSCDSQGVVLTQVLQDHDELIVFPLDAGLGSRPVDLLVDAYGIERVPSLMVNGTVYEGYQNRSAVERIVKTHLNTGQG